MILKVRRKTFKKHNMNQDGKKMEHTSRKAIVKESFRRKLYKL